MDRETSYTSNETDQVATNKTELPGYLGGAGDLIDKEPPAVDWLLFGLIEKSIIAVLTGAGSVGKSLFAMQMAACIATGLPFLGRYTSLPAPILYLSIEENRPKFHQRFSQMLTGMKAQYPDFGIDHLSLLRANFCSACLEEIPFQLSLEEKSAFSGWLRSLTDRLRPSLIVLDPLVYFLDDENNNSEIKAAYHFPT